MKAAVNRTVMAVLLTAAALCGCTATAPTPDVPIRPVQPSLSPRSLMPANNPIGTASGRAAQTSYGVPAAITSPGAGTPGGGTISLSYADTDIRTVVAQILGQILQVNYTIDPAVHGTATFHSSSPLTSVQVLPVLQALLAENGATLTQANGIYNVLASANTSTGVTPGASGAAGGLVNTSIIVPLRYASASALAGVLQPFIGPGGKVIPSPNGTSLIVAGDSATRQMLVDLIGVFDVDTLAGQSYVLLPVDDGAAKTVADSLQTALIGKNGSDDLRIVPLTRVNAILAVASRPEAIDDVRRVFGLIERNQAHDVRSWNVYYVQASQANNLAYVLQQAFTPDKVTAVPDSVRDAAQGSSTAGAAGLGTGATSSVGASGIGASGVGITGASGSGISGTEAAATPSLSTANAASDTGGGSSPAASASPLLGGLGGGENAASTDEMRIIPDEENNTLLVYATQGEDNLVNAMLAKIDVLPLQVRIDAIIAEVDLNNTLKYGTQFFFKSGGLNAALNNAAQTVTNPADIALDSAFPGFIIGGNGTGGAPLAISALNAVTNVQVLSSPELMVLNNTSAQLQVGSLVPYLASSSQSTLTNTSDIINNIGYEPTGVIMQVTPRVDQDGLVMMKITQNVSSVDTSQTSTSGIDSPTFLQRSISSSVVVQDGQTVGLAGLISDNSSRTNSGIPWLKDVPILGLLAGTQNNQRTRTELLVLLTPYVIYNQQDARALLTDLEEQLPNAAAAPYALQRPPEGLADPNQPYRPIRP